MDALNTFAKIAQVVGAGLTAAVTLTEKEEPTTQDKANACAQVVFAIVQIGDLATPPDSSERMWTAGSAGFLDLVRSGTSIVAKHKKSGDRWTWKEIAQEILLLSGTVVFRTGDVTHIVNSLSNGAEAHENCDMVISIANGAGAAISLSFSGVRLYVSIPTIKLLCQKYRQKKEAEKQKKQEVVMHVIEGNPEIAKSMQAKLNAEVYEKDEEANKNAVDIETAISYLLMNQDSPEKILYIPEVFALDGGWNRCCITEKPIRFVVAPNLPESERDDDVLDILYEKATLDKWFEEHGNDGILPPKWPSHLAFTLDNIKIDRSRQHDTNKKLKSFIDEFVTMARELTN